MKSNIHLKLLINKILNKLKIFFRIFSMETDEYFKNRSHNILL